MRGHGKGGVWSLSWSVESSVLVSGGADMTVRVWDVMQKPGASGSDGAVKAEASGTGAGVAGSSAAGTAAGAGGAGGAVAATGQPKKAKKAAATGEEDEEVDESQVGVGSIAAGGRYDGLVGMFTAAAAGEGKKAASLPCVGVSIGLDRVFAIVWPRWVAKGMRSNDTMAFVMAAGDGLLTERVQLVQELREAGIKVRAERREDTAYGADMDVLDRLLPQGETEASRAVCGGREG